MLHAWWVEPGAVLAGEYPGEPDAERAAERIDLLIDHGVRTFVDLTTPTDPLPGYDPHVAAAAQRRQLDLRRVSHPIPDFGVSSDAGYDAILATIDDATGRGAVYVHCWGGIGRTGTVVGCYLIAQGLSFDDAMARLADLRAGTRTAHRRAPEMPAQIDVLRARADRRAGGAADR